MVYDVISFRLLFRLVKSQSHPHILRNTYHFYYSKMSHKLNILSLNVRGLRNANKRRAIFSYLKNQKATIFCLQETFSKADDEKIWSAEWGGKIIFSHSSEHSR